MEVEEASLHYELHQIQEICLSLEAELERWPKGSQAQEPLVHAEEGVAHSNNNKKTKKDRVETPRDVKKAASETTITRGAGVDAALRAIRPRAPSFTIGRRLPGGGCDSSTNNEGMDHRFYDVRINFCSTRKRTPCTSFGSIPQLPEASEPKRSKIDNPHRDEDDMTGVCHACDSSCWFGCECACHDGYEGGPNNDMPPSTRRLSSSPPVTVPDPREVTHGIRFSKAPRFPPQPTVAPACATVNTSASNTAPPPKRIKGPKWGPPPVSTQVNKPLTPLPPPSPPRPSDSRRRTEPILSTQSRMPCVVITQPKAIKDEDRLTSQPPVARSPGPGDYQYSINITSRSVPGFKFAGPSAATISSSNDKPAVQVARALRHVHESLLGPGYYQVDRADAMIRLRAPTAVIMPVGVAAADTAAEAKDGRVSEKQGTDGTEVQPERPDAKAQGKDTIVDHREEKLKAKYSSDKGDDDVDVKEWGARHLSEGKQDGSSDDDSVMEYKRQLWRRQVREEAKKRKKAEASNATEPPIMAVVDPPGPTKHVRGPIMAPNCNVGVNWRNRVAIAKAREERERPSRLFGYDVSHSLTEARVTGGSDFAAQEAARQRELTRRESVPGLLTVQAVKEQSQRARDDFLGPQLAHPWAVQQDEDVRLALLSNTEAFGRKMGMSRRPVPIYRPPAEESEQARFARELKEADVKKRDHWLASQLQPDWGDVADAPALDMSKQRGREVVVVEKKGQIVVQEFSHVSRAVDDLGPGMYDVGDVVDRLKEVKAGGKALLDFGKFSTARPPEAMVMDEEAEMEGDVLQLEANPDVVKKRIKSFTFAKANAVLVGADTKVKEGDVLDLEPDRWDAAMEKRQGGGMVPFAKQGPGHVTRQPPIGEDEDDMDMFAGDVLQLEVKHSLQERRVVAPSFSKVERWAEPVRGGSLEGDDDEGAMAREPMTPLRDDVQRKRLVMGVNMSRQKGRWDREEEEAALQRQCGAQMDERDAIEYAIQQEKEASRAIYKAEGGDVLSTRSRASAGYVDMGRQKEYIPSPPRATKEEAQLAWQEAVEKGKAVERAERLLLSNKSHRVSGVDMSKLKGRADAPADVPGVPPDDREVPEGNILILSPNAQKSSKYKRTKGVLSWAKQSGPAKDESLKEPQGMDWPRSVEETSLFGMKQKGIGFGQQLGRREQQREEEEDGMALPPEGYRLILSPRLDVARPKVKGGAFMRESKPVAVAPRRSGRGDSASREGENEKRRANVGGMKHRRQSSKGSSISREKEAALEEVVAGLTDLQL